MIIGIAGHPASGKDSAAEYFKAKGFKHFSMGDLLRDIMKRQNIPVDRSHIRLFVKEKRVLEGNGYPANVLAASIDGDTVVSGFRNTAEVEVFRTKFGKEFTLLGIAAPVEVRYERIHQRQRVGDNISLERFKEEEDQERAENSGSHEVDKVLDGADVRIENVGTKEGFLGKLDEFLRERQK
jgi:dephospho-CoA kinase